MRKNKSTKRAFVASTVSLLLCISMLIGSTFAWFTDSASTGCSVIQSGRLDIILEYWDGDSWEDAEGEKLQFVKAAGKENEVVLWEPGCTYLLPKIRVRNLGNLHANTLLRLNGITGDEKLFEVLEFKNTVSNIPQSVLNGSQASTYNNFNNKSFDIIWNTPDGDVIFDWPLAAKGDVTPNSGHTDTSAEFTISAHMKEEAGNEYQNLKIEGISIQAVAKQGIYERDSYNQYYDEKATYPTFVTTIEQAEKVLASAAPGSTVIIDNINDELTIPSTAENITVVLTGTALDKINIEKGATDITLSGGGISATNSNDVLIKLNDDHGTLTVKNMNLNGVANVKAGHAISSGNGTALVVDNCTISNIGYGVQDTFSGYESLTITNSTFENTVSWAILNQGATTLVTVDNCKFINCQAGILKTTGMQPNGKLVFTNNTMTSCKEHNPYGLIQIGNKETCNITWSGNTFDGADMANPF